MKKAKKPQTKYEQAQNSYEQCNRRKTTRRAAAGFGPLGMSFIDGWFYGYLAGRRAAGLNKE